MKLLKRLMSGQAPAPTVVTQPAPVENVPAEAVAVDTMSAEDRALIRRFADGEIGLRYEAEEAYRRNVSVIGERGDDHMSFMTEVLSDHPDAAERAACRDRILGIGVDD